MTRPMVGAMSEERQTGRQGRADSESAAADVPFYLPQAEEPPPPAPPIVLSQIPGVVSPSPLGWIARRRNRLARRWLAASPNLRGSIYLFSSMLVYAVMVGGMKHIGGTIPLAEILMIRQIIMTLVIVAIARGALPMLLRTTRPGLQVTRGVITLISMLCGFWALIHIPLAQATAIGFSQVFFVTIAAVIILKERVDARRWVATIVGFGGVMVMLDPTTDGLNLYALAAIGGAFFGALVNISVRLLAATERTETILLYQGAVLMAVLAVPCWWYWVEPNANQWFWLVTLSLFGTAGQWLMTRAYQVGEASALAPLDFSRLLLACFTGFVFFGEIPALTTWIGAAIVIGATLYTIRKNAQPLHGPSPTP
jgi:drug/metabolite transporter (DMT)-like permease